MHNCYNPVQTVLTYCSASWRIPRLFAFQATALQVSLTVQFFQAYALKFLVEGSTFNDLNMGLVLSQSGILARHSKITAITCRSSSGHPTLSVSEYIWTDPSTRPWGDVIPMQCHLCHALYTIRAIQEKYPPDHQLAGRETGEKAKVCSTIGCGYREKVDRPTDKHVILPAPRGNWMKVVRSS